MRVCGLGQEFKARQPVLDDFAGPGKINYPLSPMDSAG